MPVADQASSGNQPVWMWPAIVVVVALISGLGAWFSKTAPDEITGPTIRTKVDLGANYGTSAGITISPSGRLLAISENFQQVRVMNLETGEDWVIPESDRVASMTFNADETWLLLERPRTIDRVQVRRSKPVEFLDTGSRWASPNWTPDNAVLYEDQGALMVKSLSGGEPQVFVARDSLRAYDDPFLTKDGKYVLAQLVLLADERQLMTVFSYPEGQWMGDLDIVGELPRYIDTGHIVYDSDGGIMAVAADLDPPALFGAPVPLFEEAATTRMSLTQDGHLFLGYGPTANNAVDFKFGTYALGGAFSESPVEARAYDNFAVAPTSPLRVAVEVAAEEGGESLWVLNLESGVPRRLTFGDVGDDPWWHPSGDSILYVTRENTGEGKLILKSSDGSGDPREVYKHPNRTGYPSATKDFGTIAFVSYEADADIWLLDVATAETKALVKEEGNQTRPQISPNGQFVVFQGNQVGGENRIYMQAVNGPARYGLSERLAGNPSWSPDGRSVYFQSMDGVYRVEVSTDDGRVDISNPERIDTERRHNVVPLPDGSGLVVLDREGDNDDNSSSAERTRFVDVRFNWKQELNRLVPRPEGQ
ncbi:PD40 domain-containing protein [bacterium]|nr:PD40 domain-containing protein [bacterium]